jgi:hypothetical protein
MIHRHRYFQAAVALAAMHEMQNMPHHIKPGPKPKKEDGTDDRRRHVDPPNAPKHPTLPIHDPKKK